MTNKINTIHRILHYDTQNINGVIYPKEVVEAMVSKWKQDNSEGQLTASFLSTDIIPNPNSMVGVINDMEMDDEGVIIYHHMIDSDAASKVVDLLEAGKCKLSPSMTGTVVDGKVTNCSIRYISFSAINNE